VHSQHDSVSRRVLIVEDETAFGDVVSELLVEEGFAVVRAGDGITAINMLAAQRLSPDLIVCDVMMPGIRGDHLAAEIRRRFRNRRLPLLLMSASGDPGVRLRDVAFVPKPFEVREFLSTIERLMAEPQTTAAAGS
jgi:two-component system, OmpR family, phosphate regulon response regulator OmpR